MESARLVVIVPGERKISFQIALYFRAPPPRVIIVASVDASHRVCHLPEAAKMIAREKIVVSRNLLSVLKESLCNVHTRGIPLLAENKATPKESLIRLSNPIGVLHDAATATKSVISEFRTIRANVDRNETIRRVPFIGIRRGGGDDRGLIPIEVKGQRLGRTLIGDDDLVFVGRAVVAGIRSFDGDNVGSKRGLRICDKRSPLDAHLSRDARNRDRARFIQVSSKADRATANRGVQLVQVVETGGGYAHGDLLTSPVARAVIAVTIALQKAPRQAVAVDERAQKLVHRIILQFQHLGGSSVGLLCPRADLTIRVVSVAEGRKLARIGIQVLDLLQPKIVGRAVI